jgi:hypothetical protein
MFISVKNWRGFESSDLGRNGLGIYVDEPAPDFVAESEQILDREPGLDPKVCCFLDHSFKG